MARTDAALQQATELVLATPGVKYSNGFTGRNGATFTFATNAALMFLVLDDFVDQQRGVPVAEAVEEDGDVDHGRHG